mgnify:FL=1
MEGYVEGEFAGGGDLLVEGGFGLLVEVFGKGVIYTLEIIQHNSNILFYNHFNFKLLVLIFNSLYFLRVALL